MELENNLSEWGKLDPKIKILNVLLYIGTLAFKSSIDIWYT